jgi:hypothetical protein
MNPRFLHSEQEFPKIERKKFILSIVLGVCFSFTLYSLLYLTREYLRLFSVTWEYDIWMLSDEEVNFLNLFFAFLSLIFTQSMCFSYWFGSPRKIFQKRSIHESTILSDQRVLKLSFLGWACLFALLAYIHSDVFLAYSFYPKYNYLFILLIIVLFLQPWVTIRRIYKRKSLKWMLISASIISVLAFTYSRINVFDYQKINEMILEKNIVYKYKLKLAEANTCERYPYLLEPIRNPYLCLVNQSPDSGKLKAPILVFNDNELSFDDLEKNLPHISTMEEYIRPYLYYPLYIDKSIKMSFVNRLKEILTKAEYPRIVYLVIPKHWYYPSRYPPHYFFTQRLHSEKPYKDTDLKDFELLSVSYANDSVQVNNIIYAKNNFYSIMKQEIEQHDNYLVVFSVDDEMIFADYIFVLDELRRAVHTLRNAYAVENYSREYEMLPSKEFGIVCSKIPYRLMEVGSVPFFTCKNSMNNFANL